MASVDPLIHYDESDVITKIGKDLYLSEEMADFHFTFKVDDGLYERVPAHKVFLITASDVFRAMFNGTWEENKEVEIVDASVVEFKEFLQFFYLKKVKISKDNVARVMYLGNKYNIATCMSVCEKFVINTVDENNVCSAYELAITYNQTNLKKYCEAFIGINTSAMLASENFLKCDSKILGYILNLDSLSCPETELFEACMNWVKAATKVDQLTREIVQAQLGELFYTIRFKSMTPQGFAKLVPSYGYLLSNDEYGDISQAVALEEYQPNIFYKTSRLPFNNMIFEETLGFGADPNCFSIFTSDCSRSMSKYLSCKPYCIQSIEKTKFSANTPLYLVSVLFCKIFKFHNNAYFHTEDMPTEMTIKHTTNLFQEDIVLYNEKYSLESRNATKIKLSKPLHIRPGFLYEIWLKQSPPEGCCTGSMLKTEVKIGSNITVQFYGDPTVDEDNVARGTVKSLTFRAI